MKKNIVFLFAVGIVLITRLSAMEAELTQQKLQVFIKFLAKYQADGTSEEQRQNIVKYLSKLGLAVEQKLKQNQVLNHVEACAMMLWADFLADKNGGQNSPAAVQFYEYLADQQKNSAAPEVCFLALKHIVDINNCQKERLLNACRSWIENEQEDVAVRIRAFQALAHESGNITYQEEAAKLLIDQIIGYCQQISIQFGQKTAVLGNQIVECVNMTDFHGIENIVVKKIYPLVDAYLQKEHVSSYGQALFAYEDFLDNARTSNLSLPDVQLRVFSMMTVGCMRIIKGPLFDQNIVNDLLLCFKRLAQLIEDSASQGDNVSLRARAMTAKAVYLHTTLIAAQKQGLGAEVIQYRDQAIKVYEDVIAFVKKHKRQALVARRKNPHDTTASALEQIEHDAHFSLGALKRDYNQEDSLGHYALIVQDRFKKVRNDSSDLATLQYGLLHFQKKEYQKAYDAFKKIYDISNKKSVNYQRAALCLAMIEQTRGNDVASLVFFNQVEAKDHPAIFNDFFSAYYGPSLLMNAQAYFNLDDTERALKIYDMLIEQREKIGPAFFIDACMGAGATHLFCKNNSYKATEYFLKTLMVDKDQQLAADPLVGQGLAILFSDSSKSHDAERLLDKALAKSELLAPKWLVFAKRYKAKLLGAREEHHEAENLLREVVEGFNKPEASLELAIQLVLQNELLEAKKHVKPLIARHDTIGCVAQLVATLIELHSGHKHADWTRYLNIEKNLHKYEECLYEYFYFKPVLDLACCKYWEKKGDKEKASYFLTKAAEQTVDKAVLSYAKVRLAYKELEKNDVQKAAELFNQVIHTQVVTPEIYQAEVGLALILHNELEALNLARLNIEQHEVEPLIATILKSVCDQKENLWAKYDAKRLNLHRSYGKDTWNKRKKKLCELANQTVHSYAQIEARLELAEAYQYTMPDMARLALQDIAQQAVYPSKQAFAQEWLALLDQGSTMPFCYEYGEG